MSIQISLRGINSAEPVRIPPGELSQVEASPGKINPPALRSASDYDEICSSLPRATAVRKFKLRYPEKFVKNESDEKARLVFEKWETAIKYWEEKNSSQAEKKMQAECPEEIQVIRSFLWEEIQNHQEAVLRSKWYFKAIIKARRGIDCLKNNFPIIISIITVIAIVILFKLTIKI